MSDLKKRSCLNCVDSKNETKDINGKTYFKCKNKGWQLKVNWNCCYLHDFGGS